MEKYRLLLVGIFFCLVCSVYVFLQTHQYKKQHIEKLRSSSTIKRAMIIASPAFENNELIPKLYTCDGKQLNPPLLFSNVPDTAQSLALIVEDPDAPNGTFIHWIMFNIPPQTREITQNALPENSIQGVTSTGHTGYVGPCPPSGTHHYIFTLYALDSLLSLGNDSNRDTVMQAMQGHVLEKAQLTGLYQRS